MKLAVLQFLRALLRAVGLTPSPAPLNVQMLIGDNPNPGTEGVYLHHYTIDSSQPGGIRYVGPVTTLAEAEVRLQGSYKLQ